MSFRLRLLGSLLVAFLFAGCAGPLKIGPDGLRVEARAPDGLVEAFSVDGGAGFSLCVQWHPEWQVMANDFSRSIFAAFGDAARERALARGAGVHHG